jgi:hypothetical protein
MHVNFIQAPFGLYLHKDFLVPEIIHCLNQIKVKSFHYLEDGVVLAALNER